MKNRILFFSGGLSSFLVAHYLKTTYKDDNIVLYFTDTLWEDEDLYRFIHEVSDKLELPLLIHSQDINPVELMIKRHTLFSNRFGVCSVVLKMRVARNYLFKKKKPKIEKWHNRKHLKNQNFIDGATLYFGISFEEIHRKKAIEENWKPFTTEFPLTKLYLDANDILLNYNIKKPRLYAMGFSHNNCKARCVKAGISHFKTLYNVDRKTFDEIENIESTLSAFVGAYHELKKDNRNKKNLSINESEIRKWFDSDYQYKPDLITSNQDKKYTFIKNRSIKSIRAEMENGGKIDLFCEAFGGCGCFIDYD